MTRQKGVVRPGVLATELGITPQALHRHLRRLCELGVLEKVGEAPASRYKLSGIRTALSGKQARVISEVEAILSCHPAIRLVTLFGSFARGQEGPLSDIDLLVFLSPGDAADRNDIWAFWDRHSRHLSWADKVSIVTMRLGSRIHLNTLLLDLPEEHLPVVDRSGYFRRLRAAIIEWRERNGSVRLESFGGKHAWKYSSKIKRLEEIDFELELGNVT